MAQLIQLSKELDVSMRAGPQLAGPAPLTGTQPFRARGNEIVPPKTDIGSSRRNSARTISARSSAVKSEARPIETLQALDNPASSYTARFPTTQSNTLAIPCKGFAHVNLSFVKFCNHGNFVIPSALKLIDPCSIRRSVAAGGSIDREQPSGTGVSALAQSLYVLVVDDDPRVCRLLTRFLTAEGYAVKSANSGQAMKQAMDERAFDLVILDLRLPGGEDGLSLAQQLRSQSNIPLIMLTGRSESVDKVVGLEVGADDYVTKPFDRRELLARIRSLLRRAALTTSDDAVRDDSSSVVRFAGWTLDLERHELVSSQGESVELTSYEYQLLTALARQPRRALSRDRRSNYRSRWHPD